MLKTADGNAANKKHIYTEPADLADFCTSLRDKTHSISCLWHFGATPTAIHCCSSIYKPPCWRTSSKNELEGANVLETGMHQGQRDLACVKQRISK